MGFLNFFKPKQDIRDLMILELKQDKERLIAEITELKQIINKKNKPLNLENKPLSKSEQKIYNLFKLKSPSNFEQLSQICKIKETSLRTIVSRINQKGFKIKFNQ